MRLIIYNDQHIYYHWFKEKINHMQDEIPYNPPGMDEYIAKGAEHNAKLFKRHALLQAVAAVKDGYGGVLPNGNVVDRRKHPAAIPMPENSLMDVPKPKEL